VRSSGWVWPLAATLLFASPLRGQDLPRFELDNFDGRPVTNATLLGRTTIVVPTFAKCVFACPMITLLLTELDKELGSLPKMQYLHISVQPEEDSPEEIRMHFAKHDIDAEADPRWLFASGPAGEIERLLVETGVQVTRTAVDGGVLVEHTIRVYVVGPDGGTVRTFDTYFWDAKEMRDALQSAFN
jgi:protein SCO1/2